MMDYRKNDEDNPDASSNAMAYGWARENARYYLKNVIDEEVDNLDDITPQTWRIATHNIVKRLKDSTQMTDLIDDVKKRLKIYSENTNLHVENRAEPIPVNSLKPLSSFDKWNSSRNNTARPKHQKQLAEDISHHLPLKVRIDAFRNLLNSHVPTVVSSSSWPLLQKNLVESLCDDDPEIFSCCLQMHVKLLASSSNIMKEGYFSLIDGLRSHYSRKFHKYLPTFDGGLDLTHPVHKRIIKISHLLLETSKSMTESWIRMGEKLVEEIMNVFLALISMHTYESMYSKNILYPFHVIATLDPRAKWCLQWIHCGFGRNTLLSLQSRMVTLLRYIVEEIDQYIKVSAFEGDIDSGQDGVFKLVGSDSIKLSVFSVCINVLCIIIPYKKARIYFPLPCKIQDDPVSFSDVICWLIRNLNRTYNVKCNLAFITDALVRFFKSRDNPLPLYSDIVKTVLEPMELTLSGENVETNYRVPLHTIDILDAICSSEKGVIYLVECSNFKNRSEGPYQIDTPPDLERNYNFVATILNYTDFLLNRNVPNIKPLTQLLHISSKFIKYLDQTLLFVPLTLIENVIIQFLLLHEQFKPKFSNAEINYVTSSSEDLFCSLSYFLANVLSWAGGLHSVLQSSNIIQDFVPTLFAYQTVLWESPDFCRLLFVLTSLPESEVVLSSECKKPISEALQNLWDVLEDQEAFVRGIERYSSRALIRYMNIVYNFTSSLVGTKVFFSELDDSDETLLECSCNPTSPIELINLECSLDPWHKIALLTLQTVTRNLNAWIFVESKFEIENHLLQLQTDNILSPIFDSSFPNETNNVENIIIDEYSVLRHEILTAVRVLSRSNCNFVSDVNCEKLSEYLSEHSATTKLPLTVNKECTTGWSELEQLLGNTDEFTRDRNWMIKLRKAFRSLKKESLCSNSVVDILEHVYLCNSHENNSLNWQSVKLFKTESLSREEILGIKISVRYGIHDQLLDFSLPNDQLLGELLQHTQSLLNVKENKSFEGFDWFLASVFLLCAGNIEKCHCFLDHFVTLPISLVLWPVFAEAKGKQYFYLGFSSLVEWVSKKDVPLASAALQTSGISWGLLCYNWLSQSFWNILEWKQICEWITLCIVYPPDVAVYFCAALLTYLQPRILEAASDGKIWDQIVGPFSCFSVTEYMPFIDKSISEHRSIVLPKLLQIITV